MGTYTVGYTNRGKQNHAFLPSEQAKNDTEIVSFKGAFGANTDCINWLGAEFVNHSQVALDPIPQPQNLPVYNTLNYGYYDPSSPPEVFETLTDAMTIDGNNPRIVTLNIYESVDSNFPLNIIGLEAFYKTKSGKLKSTGL